MLRKVARSLTPRRWHLHRLFEQYINDVPNMRVLSGPFEGMRYGRESHGSTYLPKILGTYEKELAGEIESVVSDNPDSVIILGAAEGYYAVGFALRLSESKIIAFEASMDARVWINELALINGVHERVQINGIVDFAGLRTALDENTKRKFLLVDIEGSEAILLDPQVLPKLRHARILVELHEFHIQGVRNILRDRFDTTHSIDEISARSRRNDDLPITLGGWRRRVFNGTALQAMNERRPQGMSWLSLSPIEESVVGDRANCRC
ncbi:MAG: hypothetical protein OEU36_15455 [Gammaproteobacteria bacterium]|nr:hypothetical protein [Gammaproteobacteria bacterium]